MTSNPTIFERAITGSTSYDADLARMATLAGTDREAFEALAIADVQEAAELVPADLRVDVGTRRVCVRRAYRRVEATRKKRALGAVFF